MVMIAYVLAFQQLGIRFFNYKDFCLGFRWQDGVRRLDLASSLSAPLLEHLVDSDRGLEAD